jgi:hypothetical protein
VPLCKLFKKKKENIELTNDNEEGCLEKIRVVETTYFVPIPTSIGKPYKDKWIDKDYLGNVKNFGCNEVFITEVTELLRELRDLKDKCCTYDEYINFSKDAIQKVKDFLTVSYRAEERLMALDSELKQDEEPNFEC